MKKRLLSMLLVFVMLLSILPVGAWAAGGNGKPGGSGSQDGPSTYAYVYAQIVDGVDQNGKPNPLTPEQINELNNLMKAAELQLKLNDDGWLTLGKVPLREIKHNTIDGKTLADEARTSPNEVFSQYGSGISSAVTSDNFTPYQFEYLGNTYKNTDVVKVSEVAWKQIIVSNGAVDYADEAPSGPNGTVNPTWHIDGTIELSQLVGLVVTAGDVNATYDGNTHPVTPNASITGLLKDMNLAIETTVQYKQGDTVLSGSELPTNAGTYTATITAKLADYPAITATTTATVTISPRPVTLTSGSDTKEYDGTPLTKWTVTASTGTNEGFVTGEGATYNVTGSQTIVGSSNNTFTYTLNSYTKASNYNITTVEGTLTVTSRSTPYAITVTANSATKEYNESEQTVTGFMPKTYTNDNGVQFTIEATASGSGTAVGEYDVTFTGTPVVKDAAGNDVTAQFRVTTVPGKLIITPASVPVGATLTAEGGAWTYDGNAHSVTANLSDAAAGYTIQYSTDGGTTWSTDVPSVTNVSDGLKTVQVKATKTGYADIPTQTVTLKITPKAVTVTAQDAGKIYGTSDPELKADVIGTIGDDSVSYTVTRATGEDAGTYTITPSGEATQGNYTVTYEIGTFTISPAGTNAVTVNGVTKTYDGTSYSIFATAAQSGSTLHYSTDSGDTKTWSETNPTFTNAGTYTVYVYATNTNFADTGVVSATVTINKRNVTLTSATDSKKYDSTPLTNGTVTVSGDGFVTGQGATYDVTGSQTEIGGDPFNNFFTYTLNDNTSEANYAIRKVYGTLTVTANTITSFSKELLTSAPKDVALPTGVTVTYPKDGKVTIPKDGSVTLLYKLTVVADPNAAYTITEEGSFVAFKADGTAVEFTVNAYSGTGPQTIYVARTFTASDITNGKLTNTASLTSGTGTDPWNGGPKTAEVDAEEEQPQPPVSTTGSVTLIKLDADTEEPLNGATFTLYTKNRSKVGQYTTNKNGKITLALPYGEYYFVEKTAPAGYLLDTAKYSFKVGSTPKTVKIYNTRSTVPAGFTKEHYAYIVGYPDGTVQPNGNITRAEVATIFFRLLDDETRSENLSTTNSFSDVSEGMWFNTAISTLEKMGILNGYQDGTFRPNEKITRAELVKIAASFEDVKATSENPFTDTNNHWAKAYIDLATENGWINGYEDNTFKPDQPITRAETMAVVNRVLQRLPKSVDDLLPDMITWPDNMDETAWYYLYVQEATNSHDYNRVNGSEKWTQLKETPDWTMYEK